VKRTRNLGFAALAGAALAFGLSPLGSALLTPVNPPSYELTRLGTNTWQLVVPDDFVTVSSSSGRFLALGLSWSGGAIASVDEVLVFRPAGTPGGGGNIGGSVGAASVIPVYNNFAPNATTTAELDAMFGGAGVTWQGFLSPSPFVPANKTAIVVMRLTTTTDDYATIEAALLGGMFAVDEGNSDGTLTLTRLSADAPAGVEAASVERVRVGTPANPSVFMPGETSPPVVGATWDPFIEQPFLPGSVIEFLFVSNTPMNLQTPNGTLLCTLPPPNLIFTVAPGNNFAVAIPNDLMLVGLMRCTQAGALAPGPVLALTNAIDVTIGTF
jgi:hypothetical protein